MNNQIGILIREIRKKRKLTQEQLGAKLGYSKAYISKIESNRQTPRLEQLEKFSKALDIDVRYLLIQTVNATDLFISDKELYEKILKKFREIDEIFNSVYFDEDIETNISELEEPVANS